MDEKTRSSRMIPIAIAGIIIVALIMTVGTFWMSNSARDATDEAVRSVSMLYLDELAGRREQVVSTNLRNNISNMRNAVELMTEKDLASVEALKDFQARMKKLYDLEKFAFVDRYGTIYTAVDTGDTIDEYEFDPGALTEPEISIKDVRTAEKKVVIAMPVTGLILEGKPLTVCFMEIDMKVMLDGFSLQSDTDEMTFCNIYTRDGTALTDLVLGGLAREDNLLSAMENAEYEEGYSLEKMISDFTEGSSGVVSFTYNDIQETLDYVPIEGTDWMLTYLIRESVISDRIAGISNGITIRSLVQALLTAAVLFIMFMLMLAQVRRNAALRLEKETFETETRVKQEEMEQRLLLQQELLEQEAHRAQQDRMITALASDYKGVYYVEPETDEGICYRSDGNGTGMLAEGEHFRYTQFIRDYAEKYVAENYRDSFLEFTDLAEVTERLSKEPVISMRYLTVKNGVESYEMLRMAGVRGEADDAGEETGIHVVGVGFTDVDEETRDQMIKSKALSDALGIAEEANKAKTVFLSNMSHEIRTPMNAIIGLDSIALNDPDISDKTRDHLEKIGSSARHLLSLINDILDVSRIESGKMVLKNEDFSFSKFLEQINSIVSTQCAEKDLRYNCSVSEELDDYYVGDSMKLRQILINILGNAVKFTPEGGEVSFKIDKIGGFSGRTTLSFEVADTGIGMDPEFIPKIFEQFSQEHSSRTNRYGSTGLGMAITKSLVEMMNGNIEVASEKGKGTTFTVTVTLMDSSMKNESEESGEFGPKDLSVLVVDDDPVACEHAVLVLKKAGIDCESVESGQEALEKVKLRHIRRDPYNLILVDWKMPEMDGVETSRRIRDIIGNESAIIILTAYNWDDVIDEALAAGVDSFVPKPLFAATVMEEFNRSAKKKRAESETAGKAELEGRRILLAEDMQVNAEIMKQVLLMKGIVSEHAVNGKVALDMFSASEPGYYDAVLMDMRMPEMDGLEATRKIRELDREDAKSVPIIALTANAFDEDVEHSIMAGLNAHLSKPVEPGILFETLESLIKD